MIGTKLGDVFTHFLCLQEVINLDKTMSTSI